jgi:hypothetical protein
MSVNLVNWGPRVDGQFLPLDIPQLIAVAAPNKQPTIMGFASLEALSFSVQIINLQI